MKQFSEVSCKYGAPMGRAQYGTPETHANLFAVVLTEGYDDGGAYWGMRQRGERLYCLRTECVWQEDIQMDTEDCQWFYTASSRKDAYQMALEQFPNLTLKKGI